MSRALGNVRFVVPVAVFMFWTGTVCAQASFHGAGDLNTALDSFTMASSWASFDPGANGVGVDPDGYNGALLVGHYVYFVPYVNGAGPHGEVLRCDTQGAFDNVSSWAAFDAGANGVGADPDGYVGAVFDGRYIYFVPHYNGTEYHGEVLRYDTQGAFASVPSWATFDAGANGVGTDPDGYWGGVFDGRYIYFVPYANGAGPHGEVLRYDTQGAFANVSSWATFDLGSASIGTHPYGYRGAVFDGRYVFLVPSYDHGEVARYDTQGAFANASSWATFDAGANGVGTDPDGYAGAIFDGRYIYFVPYHNGTEFHGEVLRHDTQDVFANVSSWATFDAGANGVGTDPDGYIGGAFDGRYVYFAPFHNGTTNHGEVLRYDTQGAFANASSWATFDAGANGVGTDPDGYAGAVFDGRYVYFAPANNGTEQHGEVLRYDTLQIDGQPIPAISAWGLAVLMLILLGAGAAAIRRRRNVAAP